MKKNWVKLGLFYIGESSKKHHIFRVKQWNEKLERSLKQSIFNEKYEKVGFIKDIFGPTEKFTRKTDCYIEIGELIFEAKLLEREIDEKRYWLGCIVCDWYCGRDFDIREIPKICNEIAEKEKVLYHIKNKIHDLKGK